MGAPFDAPFPAQTGFQEKLVKRFGGEAGFIRSTQLLKISQAIQYESEFQQETTGFETLRELVADGLGRDQ